MLKMCHSLWWSGIKPLVNIHHDILQIPSQNIQSWAVYSLPTPAKYKTNSFHMWVPGPTDGQMMLDKLYRNDNI